MKDQEGEQPWDRHKRRKLRQAANPRIALKAAQSERLFGGRKSVSREDFCLLHGRENFIEKYHETISDYQSVALVCTMD